MPQRDGGGRLLSVDAYNVLAIFLKLGVSYEETPLWAFTCTTSPNADFTATQLHVWFEEQTRQRTPTAELVRNKGPKGQIFRRRCPYVRSVMLV